MIARKFITGGFLCAASILIAAPAAQADTGDIATGAIASGSSQVNLGCILSSLSGSRTADCYPVPVG
ncbi:hypothetical protein IU500_17205 [Nocardia terpenica]|uniref:DUF320 domain-containing protein n=1 Tax=Nocardia terpenica TaxID=455432 RepID=A0A164KNZ5_9NOCA|nr:hypothetical protein [Nocardia terpenica]ATL70170.1 hypothetical protein CRH09_32295 [Nocardia terpenica]KZM71581.1 hypothetical protein AWN90_02275 [Nocardia terpenica]MBF6063225.1 hypothetical protein [Nocardia terpenica]MBF6105781.1 hypothetical protein [Nocardia terpenica]MBF6113635.1 hypothetical protein [Nocardia terpenica]